MMKLTPKQQRFVSEYLIDLNATQAAIWAGYSEKTANEQGARLLAKVSVQAAIGEAMKEREKRTEISQDYVLHGIKELIERCIQAEPVRDKEGNETGEYRFEPFAVLKGYELLGKHLKMFTEKSEVDLKGKLVIVTNVPEPKRANG
jgi:phage terminase small subunit